MALMARHDEQPAVLWQRLGEPHAESEDRHRQRATEHPEQVIQPAAEPAVACGDSRSTTGFVSG